MKRKKSWNSSFITLPAYMFYWCYLLGTMETNMATARNTLVWWVTDESQQQVVYITIWSSNWLPVSMQRLSHWMPSVKVVSIETVTQVRRLPPYSTPPPQLPCESNLTLQGNLRTDLSIIRIRQIKRNSLESYRAPRQWRMILVLV